MPQEEKTFISGTIANPNPFFARIWLRALPRLAEYGVPSLAEVVGHFPGDKKLHVLYDRDEAQAVGHSIAQLLVAKPDEFVSLNVALQDAIMSLHQGVHVLPQEGLENRSNEELWLYFDRHEQTHAACAALGWLAVLPEQVGAYLREEAKGILAGKEATSADGAALSLLLAPDEPTYEEQEQEDILRLAADIQAQPELVAMFLQAVKAQQYEALLQSLPISWVRRLEDHHRRYCFTELLGQGLRSLASFVDDVARTLRQVPDAAGELARITKSRVSQAKQKQVLLDQLQLPQQQLQFLKAYREALTLKSLRRYAQMYALYRMIPVLQGLARRLSVDVEMLQWLLPEEVEGALLRGRQLPDSVMRRASGCKYRARATNHAFEDHGAHPVIMPPQGPLSEWRGLTANRGYAKGPAFLLTPQRVADTPDGAIVLVKHTRPEYAPAFAKAAAIVCDQGGVTSHAAIMAREQGVPCVVATKCTSESLKDGDLVEVDANQGVVRML